MLFSKDFYWDNGYPFPPITWNCNNLFYYVNNTPVDLWWPLDMAAICFIYAWQKLYPVLVFRSVVPWLLVFSTLWRSLWSIKVLSIKRTFFGTLLFGTIWQFIIRVPSLYTRKNLTTCNKSANKPSTSSVRTACYNLSTSLEQIVNNL